MLADRFCFRTELSGRQSLQRPNVTHVIAITQVHLINYATMFNLSSQMA
jgi:hypothetical protein